MCLAGDNEWDVCLVKVCLVEYFLGRLRNWAPCSLSIGIIRYLNHLKKIK